MTHLDPQPAPTPGHGDVWLDVMRDVSGPVPWRRFGPWKVVDRRDGDRVLGAARWVTRHYVLGYRHDPRALPSRWWFTPLRPVLSDMYTRREQGLARYGTPLQYDNGRDHWTDAYQEALDLVVYLHAARAPWWMRWGAVLFVAVLRKRVPS